MRFLVQALGLASVASAHTLFTTMFINGENQGDGTCVRTPYDGKTSTGPIYPLNGDDMACGRDGGKAVPYICPASSGATITFQFREAPDWSHVGSIDESHQGPCAVYMKKVNDMFSDSASGPGWFKIWEDGFHADTRKWCVDTLIENNGLLSVTLPSGLPAGSYLIRPEILALQQAYRGDPQFYQGCGQIAIQSGPGGDLNIPLDKMVSIPGYLSPDDPGLTFNLYEEDGADYQIPGPAVYRPEAGISAASSQTSSLSDIKGVVPADCVVKNANWCAKSIPKFSDQDGCWAGVKNCWNQAKSCWDTTQVTGHDGCDAWANYCTGMNKQCESGVFVGPPQFEGGQDHSAPLPGPIPEPYNISEGTEVTGPSKSPPKEQPKKEPTKEEPKLEPIKEEPSKEAPAKEEPVKEPAESIPKPLDGETNKQCAMRRRRRVKRSKTRHTHRRH